MNLYFQASDTLNVRTALKEFTRRYGQTPSPKEADIIVSLGGDGQTLISLQDAIRFKKPVFGINFGHTGHLQNIHKEYDGLIERIHAATTLVLCPLHLEATFLDGTIMEDFAVNEALICNHNRTATIHLRVILGGQEHIADLSGDGLIVATTVGSTGYSKSASGPILPLDDDLIVLTPNNPQSPEGIRANPIRPRPVEVQVIDPVFRQADVYVDNHKVGEGATTIKLFLDKANAYEVLFDPGQTLHEKIMRTQFPASRLG